MWANWSSVMPVTSGWEQRNPSRLRRPPRVRGAHCLGGPHPFAPASPGLPTIPWLGHWAWRGRGGPSSCRPRCPAGVMPGAPGAVLGLELRSLVADDVTRSATGGLDGLVQERAQLLGAGFMAEGSGREHGTGEVVLDGDDVPAAGPVQGKGLGNPRNQNPNPVGTTVMSTCQRWCGYLAVTTRDLAGLCRNRSISNGFCFSTPCQWGTAEGWLFLSAHAWGHPGGVVGTMCRCPRAPQQAAVVRT